MVWFDLGWVGLARHIDVAIIIIKRQHKVFVTHSPRFARTSPSRALSLAHMAPPPIKLPRQVDALLLAKSSGSSSNNNDTTSPSLVVATSSLNGPVWDGQVVFFDAQWRQQLAVTTWSGCTDVCWLSGGTPGTVVVGADDGSLTLIDPSKISEPQADADAEASIRSYHAHNSAVLCVAAPTVSSKMVASGGEDGLVQIWSLEDETSTPASTITCTSSFVRSSERVSERLTQPYRPYRTQPSKAASRRLRGSRTNSDWWRRCRRSAPCSCGTRERRRMRRHRTLRATRPSRSRARKTRTRSRSAPTRATFTCSIDDRCRIRFRHWCVFFVFVVSRLRAAADRSIGSNRARTRRPCEEYTLRNRAPQLVDNGCSRLATMEPC